MPKIYDGGQAFPSDELDQDGVPDGWQNKGMSLRDWFAGQALAGQGAWIPPMKAKEGHIEAKARFAYAIADAMLAEREKTDAEP